jgi:ABC-type glycerol-3-phosphate transport system permease component
LSEARWRRALARDGARRGASGRRRWGRALRYLVLIAACVITLFPLVWALSASFKRPQEVLTIPVVWLPPSPQPQNYIVPFLERPMFSYFKNSVIVTVAATAGNLLLAALAGYGFAKFAFWGRSILFLFVLSTFMLPVQVIMVPLFITVKNLNWLNTYQGLIIPVMASAFSVFFMRQYILSIPDDYIDAARIDGASEIGIFVRIILPLCTPALAGIGILTAMFNWDEFLWPLLVATKEEIKTLPLGLATFESIYRSSYNQLMAMAIVALVPLLLAYIFAQKRFMASVALSGMK